MYERIFKRFFDFSAALLMLAVLIIPMLAVAVLVRVKLGSPVLFRQKRPGKNEKIFMLYKFRTMTDKKDENGNLLPDGERMTKFGKFLRSTSIDELPELINILKGDMSFVGPRPLLVKYLPRYNERQRHRHDVRPGLTGLAQAMGRNTVSWEEKFEYDVTYAENITFMLDIKIIFKTAISVLKREGISSGTDATMEEFMGSEQPVKEKLDI